MKAAFKESIKSNTVFYLSVFEINLQHKTFIIMRIIEMLERETHCRNVQGTKSTKIIISVGK